jgi:hypothetical protein
MNSKDHVLRLAALEREFTHLTDDEMTVLIEKLEPQARHYIAGVAGSADEGPVDVGGLRGAMRRGRMKGVPERVAAVLTDKCLNDCIEALGENADFPSEEDLAAALPSVVRTHGVAPTRIMMAAVVLGEAPAAKAIIKTLKTLPLLQPATAHA